MSCYHVLRASPHNDPSNYFRAVCLFRASVFTKTAPRDMAYNAVMLRTLHRAPAHLCEPLRKMWGQVETLPPWCPLVVARVWWISLVAVAAGTQQSWLLVTGTLNLLSRTFSGIKAQRRHLWVCKRSLSMFSVHTNCLVLFCLHCCLSEPAGLHFALWVMDAGFGAFG